ncbi:MAG: hypothetical protein EPN22_16830 [Nitrospirae bacterium]|nr:MAG: hypothetical protein EPN22_16830 [Nitrospirota bacterium]
MNNLSIKTDDLPFDPCELSKKWLIVAMFLQSSSSNYKEAVSISGSCSYFQQIIIEGKQINLVGFGKSHKEISKFTTLQGLIGGWKGTSYFAGGRPITDAYACIKTLNCFLLSLFCRKHEAYCWDIIEHPFYREDKYSVGGMVITLNLQEKEIKEQPFKIPLLPRPCKQLEITYLSKHHPSKIIDQVQARAVELNVDWCPNFNADATKTIER